MIQHWLLHSLLVAMLTGALSGCEMTKKIG